MRLLWRGRPSHPQLVARGRQHSVGSYLRDRDFWTGCGPQSSFPGRDAFASVGRYEHRPQSVRAWVGETCSERGGSLTEGWTLAFVALWILQIAVVVVVVGLARQVGLLHLRLRPVGPGAVEDGPPIGSHVESATFSSLLSRPVPVPDPSAELTLLVFASPRCSLCGPVLEGLKRLSAVESSFGCVPVVDDDGNLGLSYLMKYGFSDGIAANELKSISVESRPFGVVLDREGVVLSSGITNTLEQLEELVFQAKHALTTEDDEVGDLSDQAAEGDLVQIAVVSAQRPES